MASPGRDPAIAPGANIRLRRTRLDPTIESKLELQRQVHIATLPKLRAVSAV